MICDSYSEMDAFDSVLLKAGFEVNDFSVVDVDNERTTFERHRILGKVTVRRTSTDEAAANRAGYLSRWVSEFGIDLHQGNFGQL